MEDDPPAPAALIAVTGSTGYVGGRLIARLQAEGAEPRGLARQPRGAGEVAADLTRPETLPAALAGVQVLVHCAAITAEKKERRQGEYEQVNAGGTRSLVRAAVEAGVQRIVLLNGLGTQPGRPRSYMRTRWEMFEAVRDSGLGWVALQPSILFGAGATFQTAIADLLRISPVLPILGGGLCVQPLWIEDLVTCLVMAARRPRWDGRAIDLGGPERTTMKEFFVLIAQAAGRRRPPVPLPLPVARLQARLMSALVPRPPLTPATLELFDFDNCTDADAVASNFGFRPASVRDHYAVHRLD